MPMGTKDERNLEDQQNLNNKAKNTGDALSDKELESVAGGRDKKLTSIIKNSIKILIK